MDDLSLDELTWLKASELLDMPPAEHNDIFMQASSSTESQSSSSSSARPPSRRHTSASSSRKNFDTPVTPPRKAGHLSDSPRSEWIYRQPKSPRSANSSPRPRPQTGHRNYHSPTISSLSRIVSTTSTRTVHRPLENQGQFWSAILHPRSRSERSIPLLASQISLSRSDAPAPSSLPSTPKRNISSPRLMSARPPSISSSLSSVSSSPSPSPSSSRSESPVTPVSSFPSPYAATSIHRRSTPYHHRRRHRTSRGESDSLISASCPPPSRSILARTPSVATKDSTHTINKCVKFAATPTVHYARAGYWDVELRPADADAGEDTMGINLDAMDLDADPDPFANYQAHSYRPVRTLDAARLREMRDRQATPTPARERARARGLRRLMSLSRADPPAGTPSAEASAPAPASPPSAYPARPAISPPYALGAYPAQSTASLRGARAKSPLRAHAHVSANGSVPDLGAPARGGLRSAPSMESVRSSKSAARSVRSLGSVKSTASMSGLKAWFGRTLGWSEP